MSDWVTALLGKLYVSGIEQPLRGGLEIAGDLALTPSARGYQLDVKPGRTLREQDSNLVVGTSGAAGLPTPIDPETITHTRGAHTRQGVVPFATTSDLRAVTPVAGRVAETVDAVTAGDGGGGQWEAFAGSPGSWVHNGIDTLVPSSGTGSDGSRAWVRKNYEFLTPEMAGCAGDGSTDDRVNFLAVCARAVANNKPVRVTKIHALSTALILTSAHNGLTLEGSDPANAGFVSTGTSKDVVHISGATGVTIKGMRIEGNGTTVGGTAFAGADGHGISFVNAQDLTVAHCAFSNIANPDAGSTFGTVAGRQSSKIRITNCYFDPSCVGQTQVEEGEPGATGCTFFMSYGVHDTIVTGCIDESQMDISGYYSAVTYVATDSDPLTDEDVGSDLIRHVFSNNIVRRTDDGCRTGLLCGYSGRCVMVASGNIFEGFEWNGVYGSEHVDTEELTAGNVVTSNIIRYCGGSNESLSAGVLMGGTQGGVIANNHILWQGYRRDGTERGEAVHSIKLHATRGMTVSGNSCWMATGYNLYIGPGEGGNGIREADIAITGNAFVGGKIANTYILGGWDDPESIKNIRYTGNTHHAIADGAHGLWLNFAGEATQPYKSLDVSSCSFRSSAASPGSGIHLRTSSDIKATFADCRISSFSYGLRHYGGITGRNTPHNVWVHHLRVEDCGRGISGYTASIPFYVFDCVITGSSIANLANGATMAQLLGPSPVSADLSLVNEFVTVTPANGDHYVGDRWTNTAPVAGGKTGGVCVTAGNPGTYVDEYLPLTGSAVVDVTSIADQATYTSSGVTITGVALGDFVDVSCSVDLQGLVLRGHVSATNTVIFTLSNQTGAPVDLSSATYKFRVWRA